MGIAPGELTAFLEALRDDGFDLGPRDFIRAERLLVAHVGLGDAPRTLAEFSPQLGPIVCRSATEQSRFQAFVASNLGERLAPEPPAPLLPPRPPAVEKQADEARQALQHAGRARRLILVAALMLVLGTSGALWWLIVESGSGVDEQVSTVQKQAPDGQPTPPAAGAAGQPAPAGGVATTPSPSMESEPTGRLLAWLDGADRLLLAALPWLGLLLALWFRGRQDRRMERRLGSAAETVSRLDLLGDSGGLFVEPRLRRSLMPLKLHRALPSRRIDIEATVLQTIREAGFPTLRRRTRAMTPDYLVLSGAPGGSSPAAHVVDDLVAKMRREAIHVAHYRFTRAGDVLTPTTAGGRARGPPMQLQELASRFGDYRLILVDEGRGLLDPLTRGIHTWARPLQGWRERVMITPVPESGFGSREQLLAASGFRIVSLATDPTLSGLGRLFTDDDLPGRHDGAAAASDGIGSRYPRSLARREAGWVQPTAPPPARQKQLLRELHAYLDDAGYYWLQATAVFPKMISAVTRHLGANLDSPGGGRLGSLPRYLALGRLPWFRRGYMPDWLRQRLIEDLPAEREEPVRTLMLQLMCRTHAGAGGASAPAGELIPLQVIRRDNRTWSEHVLRLARRAPRDSPLQEHLFIDFLAPQARSPLALAVPRQMLAGFRRRLDPDLWLVVMLAAACSMLIYLLDPRFGAALLGWIAGLAPVLQTPSVAALLVALTLLALAVMTHWLIDAWRGVQTGTLLRRQAAVTLAAGAPVAWLTALVLAGIPDTELNSVLGAETSAYAAVLWAKVGLLAALCAWLVGSVSPRPTRAGWQPAGGDVLASLRRPNGPAWRFALLWIPTATGVTVLGRLLDLTVISDALYPFPLVLDFVSRRLPEGSAITPLLAAPALAGLLAAAFRQFLGGWQAVARAVAGAVLGALAIDVVVVLAEHAGASSEEFLVRIVGLGQGDWSVPWRSIEAARAHLVVACALAGAAVAVSRGARTQRSVTADIVVGLLLLGIAGAGALRAGFMSSEVMAPATTGLALLVVYIALSRAVPAGRGRRLRANVLGVTATAALVVWLLAVWNTSGGSRILGPLLPPVGVFYASWFLDTLLPPAAVLWAWSMVRTRMLDPVTREVATEPAVASPTATAERTGATEPAAETEAETPVPAPWPGGAGSGFRRAAVGVLVLYGLLVGVSLLDGDAGGLALLLLPADIFSEPAFFAEVAIHGAAAGMLYGLGALALVLVLRTSGFLNLALGALVLVAGNVQVTLQQAGLSPLLAVVAAFPAMAALCLWMNGSVVGRLRRARAHPVVMIAAAVAVGWVLEKGVVLVWGRDAAPLESGLPDSPLIIGDMFIQPVSLGIAAVAGVVMFAMARFGPHHGARFAWLATALVAVVLSFAWGYQAGVGYGLESGVLNVYAVLLLVGPASAAACLWGGLVVGVGQVIFDVYLSPVFGSSAGPTAAFGIAAVLALLRARTLEARWREVTLADATEPPPGVTPPGFVVLHGRPFRPAVAGVAAVLVIGSFVSEYWLFTLGQVLVWALAAIGLNLLVARARLVSLGAGSLMLLGSYVAFVVSQRFPDAGAIPAVIVAGAVAAAGGVLLCGAWARGSLYPFLLVTIGAETLIRWTTQNSDWLSGGSSWGGVVFSDIAALPLPGGDSPTAQVALAAIVLAACAMLAARLAGRAHRDGAHRPTSPLRTIALSSLYFGMAGAMFSALLVQFVEPASFSESSARLLLIVALGGLGSLRGALLGAAVFVLVPALLDGSEWLGSASYQGSGMLLGLVTLLVLLAEPRGLVGLWDRFSARSTRTAGGAP